MGTLPWYFDWNITMVFQFVYYHDILIGTLPWYFDWNITMVFQFVSCHGISICILPWLYGYVPHLGILI
jgi:hypothetical protein